MDEDIKRIISDSLSAKQALLQDAPLRRAIAAVTQACVAAFQNGNKLLFCGNGGSAADAQHLAAELSGRFYFDRPPLPAEALHVNSSFLTAVANDYGYDAAYARMVEAIGQAGDVMFAISTSGNSPNILKAVKAAKDKDMLTIGLSGRSGGQLSGLVDVLLCMPSTDTPRIQECHILVGHIICELIEQQLFKPPHKA